ncbi:hypothetical protein [Cupriavidus pinatubonensis]|uniref:Lipoprotein n=1 Tax=Cupriavidus pinatubonensis TaxID=248026 RepID=A0ABM8Y2Q1_9BURK|nr:hypothetical protein [Cupriavidus pinatubonensis]CAG9187043.1 hypothetical protein LMG23994_06524 [Cupriavidus pinatubonensis]
MTKTTIFTITAIAVLFSGCTTMDAIKSSGDNLSKGNLLAAAMNLVFTPIALAYDVVTLGGNVSPEVATTAAGAYAESQGYVAAGTISKMIEVTSASNSTSSSSDTSSSVNSGTSSTTSKFGASNDSVGTTVVGAGGKGKGNCSINTAFLAPKIPTFNSSDLKSIRDMAVSTDIVDAMRQANGQGYTPQAAVKAALDQARAFDTATKEALQTASAVDAFGTTDEEFLNRLRNGSLNLNKCDGIRNSALCSAGATKIGAIFNRAVAAEMQCHIRAGTWPGGSSSGTTVATSDSASSNTSRFTAPAAPKRAPLSGYYDPSVAERMPTTRSQSTTPTSHGGTSSNKGAR